MKGNTPLKIEEPVCRALRATGMEMPLLSRRPAQSE